MASFTLEEVCKATGAESCGEFTLRFGGVCIDTRKIKQGDLYIALCGESFDGHDFAAAAVASGAAGVVATKELSLDVPVFKVEDTVRALQDLARFHRLRFDVPVIAITGSNGKTTTKDMVAAALSQEYEVLKTQGNFNNEIGLPLTLLQMTSEHQAAVVEMGMRGKGQIRELMRVACPTMGVVTNVGETHMELLGSIEAIAAAKAELVEELPAGAAIVLNHDNEHVRAMAKLAKGKVVFYGFAGEIDVKALKSSHREGRTNITLSSSQGEWQLEIPVSGRHNVSNALAAIAVAEKLGVSRKKIAAGLAALELSAMRLHLERRGEFCIINDAYNASPMSMLAALDALQEIAAGRKIAVLGDMLELGAVSVEAHVRVGKCLAQSDVAALIALGTEAKHLAEAARSGGKDVFWTEDAAVAKRRLKEILLPGDTVLLKGSRGMRMEQFLEVFESCSK